MFGKRQPEIISLPTNIAMSDTTPLMGGLSAARTSCYCTGECRTNPCHPCNGGRTGRPMQDGWSCPKCGAVYAPWVPSCWKCNPRKTTFPTPTADCGCGPNQVCMNAACPRRIQITCSS